MELTGKRWKILAKAGNIWKKMEHDAIASVHLWGMQINYHPNHGGGNWIAFLFGAVFNIAAHIIDPGPASYMVHAIAGGLICLMFKMLGDLFTPLVRRLGQRFSRWLESKVD